QDIGLAMFQGLQASEIRLAHVNVAGGAGAAAAAERLQFVDAALTDDFHDREPISAVQALLLAGPCGHNERTHRMSSPILPYPTRLSPVALDIAATDAQYSATIPIIWA